MGEVMNARVVESALSGYALSEWDRRGLERAADELHAIAGRLCHSTNVDFIRGFARQLNHAAAAAPERTGPRGPHADPTPTDRGSR